MRDQRRNLHSATPALIAAGIGASGWTIANGQTQFDEAELIPTPDSVSGVAIADMDGDGWRDLISCEGLESVRIFANQHNGQFTLIGSHFEAGARLSGLRTADIDRSGSPDLIWSSTFRGTYSLQVYFNAGDGHAARLERIPLGREPAAVAVGDFTPGGILEIAAIDGFDPVEPSHVHVFRMRGGAFVETQTFLLDNNHGRDLVAGDIDGDGDTDLVALSIESYYDTYYGIKGEAAQADVLLNDGLGTFSIADPIPLPFETGFYGALPANLHEGDFDGDGDIDLAVFSPNFVAQRPNLVEIIESRNSGSQWIPRNSYAVGGEFYAYARSAVADFDTDGDLDILVTQDNANQWVLVNDGSLAFHQEELSVRSGNEAIPAVGDLDNDGQTDVATCDRFGIAVLLNATPYGGPLLAHTPLNRGVEATLAVADAQPGERVDFLYTTHGAGNSLGVRQLGGITLDLNDPIQILGTARADSNGVAQFRFTVPPRAPLTEVVLQAVIRRGPGGADSVKTPFRTARITD